MKKFLTVGLSMAMAASMLAGCSAGGDTAKDESVLTIAGLEGGYGTKGWEKVIDLFEKEYDVKVESTFSSKIADELRPQLQAGDTPDLIYLSVGSEGGLTDTMIKEKNLLEIDDVLDMTVPGEDVKVGDKLIDGIEEQLNTMPYGDGKLYLMPINYGPCGLYYNAGLFEQKGWTVPTTWDEMWELGDKAKAEGISLFTYPTTGYFDAFFSALLNETAGPDVYAKLMAYDSKAWETPEVKKAFEIVGKLAEYTEPNTVANANGDNFKKNQQLILDNKALFCPNGNWLPSEMEDAPRADGFKWGVTALPKVTADGNAYATTFTEQVYIPKDAANADLAKKFLAFMYSDKAVKAFYEEGKGALMPVKGITDVMPEDDPARVYNGLYENGAYANGVGFKVMDKEVEGVNVSDPNNGILYATVNSVVNGEKTVDEWYDAVIDAVKKIEEANK